MIIIEAVGKPSDCCMQLRSPAFHKAGLLLFSAQCELRPGIRGIPLKVASIVAVHRNVVGTARDFSGMDAR